MNSCMARLCQSVQHAPIFFYFFLFLVRTNIDLTHVLKFNRLQHCPTGLCFQRKRRILSRPMDLHHVANRGQLLLSAALREQDNVDTPGLLDIARAPAAATERAQQRQLQPARARTRIPARTRTRAQPVSRGFRRALKDPRYTVPTTVPAHDGAPHAPPAAAPAPAPRILLRCETDKHEFNRSGRCTKCLMRRSHGTMGERSRRGPEPMPVGPAPAIVSAAAAAAAADITGPPAWLRAATAPNPTPIVVWQHPECPESATKTHEPVGDVCKLCGMRYHVEMSYTHSSRRAGRRR